MKNKILAFTASWCTPCKNMKPVLEKLKDDVIIYDVEVHKDETSTFSINFVPTFVILNSKNEEVSRIVGATSYQRLKSFIT